MAGRDDLLTGGRGARRVGVRVARRRGRRAPSPPCTGCSGSRSTWPPSARWCSRSTTCTGATGRRCASSPTSRGGSRASRSWSPRPCARNEPGTDVALLGEIAHDPATVSIRPVPLSAEAVRAWCASALGAEADEPFCAACHEATGGNPLYLRQLLTALESDSVKPVAANAGVVLEIGPRAVSRTVIVRLARLSPDAIAVARAVAVLTESATLPAVAALTGIDEARVADATGALARAEILRPEAPLAFVHALVRDAVYQELPLGERELQHEQAARVLREAGAPPEQVAAHLLAAPRRGQEWVAEQLRDAGRAAVGRGGAGERRRDLRRALEEPRAGRVAARAADRARPRRGADRGPRRRRPPEGGVRDARRRRRAGARGVRPRARARLHRPRRRGRRLRRPRGRRAPRPARRRARRPAGGGTDHALLRRRRPRGPGRARGPLRAAASGLPAGHQAGRGDVRAVQRLHGQRRRLVRRGGARRARGRRARDPRQRDDRARRAQHAHPRRHPRGRRPLGGRRYARRTATAPCSASPRSTCGTASRCSSSASSTRRRRRSGPPRRSSTSGASA